jgi:O-antigen/teichoic acid export membrane protein
LITKKQPAIKTEPAPFALSFRANFSWTFVGNVVYAACQWGMVILLTKLGSSEMVGRFALGLAVTAPIILLANLQLRNIQAADAKREFQFGHYWGLRIVTTAVALLAISLVALFSGYRWEIAIIIFIIGIAKSFEALSDVFYGFLQQQERMDWIAKSLMIKGVLSLVALGLGVYLFGSLVWGVIGMAVAWAFILITYDYRSGVKVSRLAFSQSDMVSQLEISNNKIRAKWKWSILKRLMIVALPLGMVTMLVSLNSNIPRYLIEHYWGESELGIFAAIAYLMVVGRTMVGALGQSAIPRLSQHYAAGHFLAYKKLLMRLVAFGAIVGAVAILIAAIAGQEVLTLVYQPEYARQDIFVLLMMVAAIHYVAFFLNYGMVAAGYFRVQLPLNVLVVVITTLIGFWLIPVMGLQGAAWALMSGAILQMLLSSLVVRHAINALEFGTVG